MPDYGAAISPIELGGVHLRNGSLMHQGKMTACWIDPLIPTSARPDADIAHLFRAYHSSKRKVAGSNPTGVATWFQ